jgi:hypothetical protein
MLPEVNFVAWLAVKYFHRPMAGRLLEQSADNMPVMTD